MVHFCLGPTVVYTNHVGYSPLCSLNQLQFAFTPLEKGFRTCGQWPIDDSVFTEDDFAASLMTEELEPGSGAHAATSSGRPGGEASSAAESRVVRPSRRPAADSRTVVGVPPATHQCGVGFTRQRGVVSRLWRRPSRPPGGETSRPGGEASSATSRLGDEVGSAADCRAVRPKAL